jgi:hypothetical protein
VLTARAVSGWTGKPVGLWWSWVVLRQSARCRPMLRGHHGVTPFVQEPLVDDRTGHDRCWNVMCSRTVQYSICHTFTWLYY